MVAPESGILSGLLAVALAAAPMRQRRLSPRNGRSPRKGGHDEQSSFNEARAVVAPEFHPKGAEQTAGSDGASMRPRRIRLGYGTWPDNLTRYVAVLQ